MFVMARNIVRPTLRLTKSLFRFNGIFRIPRDHSSVPFLRRSSLRVVKAISLEPLPSVLCLLLILFSAQGSGGRLSAFTDVVKNDYLLGERSAPLLLVKSIASGMFL